MAMDRTDVMARNRTDDMARNRTDEVPRNGSDDMARTRTHDMDKIVSFVRISLDHFPAHAQFTHLPSIVEQLSRLILHRLLHIFTVCQLLFNPSSSPFILLLPFAFMPHVQNALTLYSSSDHRCKPHF